MNDLQIPIKSRGNDPRLKRNINHDPMSGLYAKRVNRNAEIRDVEWSSLLMNPLDQGNIGSCTANAANNVLAHQMFRVANKYDPRILDGTQKWPLDFYHDETLVDGYPGVFPPDDTGSDGLTSAKVAKKRGHISGYTHTFTALDAILGLKDGPATWGTLWKEDMYYPSDDGQVKYSGAVMGGHQMCLYKVVAAKQQLWFRNSWGAWGYQNSGVAWISFDDFARSLRDQGDVTFFTPVSQPAPVPTPNPAVQSFFDSLRADLAALEDKIKSFLGL